MIMHMILFHLFVCLSPSSVNTFLLFMKIFSVLTYNITRCETINLTFLANFIHIYKIHKILQYQQYPKRMFGNEPNDAIRTHFFTV